MQLLVEDAWRKNEEEKQSATRSRKQSKHINGLASVVEEDKESPEKQRSSNLRKFVVEDSTSPLKKPGKADQGLTELQLRQLVDSTQSDLLACPSYKKDLLGTTSS